MKKFVITTPIYYVNAAPHIGHAYTTLAADILARHHRAQGRAVHLLTGTDEHGSKIEETAKANGESPADYAGRIAGLFKELWSHLDVRYDDFIRTTEARHTKRVQAVFAHLLKTGDIYKGKYKGYYCVACETYWTDIQAPPGDGGRRLCPNEGCRKELTLTEEESYFFRLSRYGDKLLEHYEKNPGFLLPASRANEIIRLVKDGLSDLAVSRTKVAWGIPVLSDPGHVVYVWFDALQNYITAAGYNPPGLPGPEGFSELWPADIQLVGKEIYRFHAIIWPAMLLALGLPPPGAVFAHGWWTVEGEKMSKSKGNFIDPREITAEFGVDALRYFLFREMPFGNDGDFSRETLLKRYNSELANDLGNLVSRTTTMVDKYLGGALPGRPAMDKVLVTKELLDKAEGLDAAMRRLAFQEALDLIWSGVRRLNERVDQSKPWALAKTDPEAVRVVLFDIVSSLRVLAGWIAPFMPDTATKMHTLLGVRRPHPALTPEEVLAGAPSDAKVAKAPPLFPRKEV